MELKVSCPWCSDEIHHPDPPPKRVCERHEEREVAYKVEQAKGRAEIEQRIKHERRERIATAVLASMAGQGFTVDGAAALGAASKELSLGIAETLALAAVQQADALLAELDKA